jgi:Flp pilus assembly protein CpaB
MKKTKISPMLIGAFVFGLAALGLIFYGFNQLTTQLSERDAKMQQLESALNDVKNRPQTTEVKLDGPKSNMRPVVYATQPIAANQKLERVLVETKATPEDLMMDAYTSIDEVTELYAARNIEPGEAITTKNVAKTFQTLSKRLPPGMRAVALPVVAAGDRTGGFVVDGDHVDLLLSFNQVNGISSETVTVMQNVKVLYVPGNPRRSDQTAGLAPAAPPGTPIVTTFEVTPEQAEWLVMLTHMGSISMVLRHQDDVAEVRTKGANALQFLDDPRVMQKVYNQSIPRVEELKKRILAELEKNKESTNNGTNSAPPPLPPSPQP